MNGTLTWYCSVDRPPVDRRTQADRQGERNHKVSSSSGRVGQMALMQEYREDDSQWPRKNIVGKQELEIRLGNEHISFEVSLRDREGPHEAMADIAPDRQNRIPERRAGLAGSGRAEGVLLSDSGSQGLWLGDTSG